MGEKNEGLFLLDVDDTMCHTSMVQSRWSDCWLSHRNRTIHVHRRYWCSSSSLPVNLGCYSAASVLTNSSETSGYSPPVMEEKRQRRAGEERIQVTRSQVIRALKACERSIEPPVPPKYKRPILTVVDVRRHVCDTSPSPN